MGLFQCHFRTVLAATGVMALLISLTLASVANADNGFWIRKGTSTKLPNRAIQKTKIAQDKAAKKKSVAKKTPVDAASKVVAGSNTIAGSDSRNLPPLAGKPEAKPTGPSSGSGTKARSALGPGVATVANAERSVTLETAQPKGPYVGVTFSDPVQQKWRVGVVLVTGSNPVRDVFTYIPIPKQWPEQSVTTFDEEIPVEFAVQKIDELDGLDRLILRGRLIEPKKKIVALQTFMVTTSKVNPPPDTTIFSAPASKGKLAKTYIASSAGISYRNSALRKQAEALFQTKGTAWEKVERIFDWVRENIDQGGGDPYGSVTTFAKKEGHPEDVVGLFIAMCRANKIPARMVFVDGTQYAEFMLADPAGELHWFPCDVVGIRAFGKIVEPKVILQKGDNIRVPGVKGKKKFVAAYGEVKSATAPKLMQFVREPLSN